MRSLIDTVIRILVQIYSCTINKFKKILHVPGTHFSLDINKMESLEYSSIECLGHPR